MIEVYFKAKQINYNLHKVVLVKGRLFSNNNVAFITFYAMSRGMGKTSRWKVVACCVAIVKKNNGFFSGGSTVVLMIL